MNLPSSEVRRDHDLRRAWLLGHRWAWTERRRLQEAERFVLFIGHGFSGHSLVGSLLDAHPDAAISHELDVVRFLDAGFSRRQLMGLICYRQQAWESAGRVQNAYSYRVDGQWQGRTRRLTVIGDKKGGLTTMRLADDPTLLARLRAEIGLPLRVVHVTRDPLDNIGSMIRTMGYSPEQAVRIWRRQVETCTWIHGELAVDELHVVGTEQVKAAAAEWLADLCRFVGLVPTPDYLDACAALVDPEPSRSRSAVATWPDRLLHEVHEVTAEHAFLQPYVGQPAHAQSWPSSAASASSNVPR
jgi:hypothetical protein